MILRAALAATLALSLLGCSGPGGQVRLREQLDAYSIPKPLAEVWPDALRFVSARGFELVGKDRRVLGQEEQSVFSKIFTAGHETQAVSGRQWKAETASNRQRQRYRVLGTQTGPERCRIEFYSLQAGDPLRDGEMGGPAREFRDLQLEVEFVETYDAEQARRIAAAAQRAP
jgi:hypothetical protein